MCALTLTALSPFPLNPPAGADEPAAPADAPAAGAAPIGLLGITDLHGHISRTTQTDSGTGQTSVEDPGAVTLACEVSSARAANPNTLFVSAGDSVGGSAYVSSILQDRPTMEALNAMSLDVSALGNHELDQGLTDLETRILPASNFPILAANVSGSTPLSAEGGGKGTFIKEVGGVRVGRRRFAALPTVDAGHGRARTALSARALPTWRGRARPRQLRTAETRCGTLCRHHRQTTVPCLRTLSAVSIGRVLAGYPAARSFRAWRNPLPSVAAYVASARAGR